MAVDYGMQPRCFARRQSRRKDILVVTLRVWSMIQELICKGPVMVLSRRQILIFPLSATLLLAISTANGQVADAPFAIEVIDAATGRGVPLVELETVDHVKFVTDSNGLIAV